MSTKNKFCQSCGMPMKNDKNGGGTNIDATHSDKYCSYCYLNGIFTFNGTVDQMQEHCRQKMVEAGHSKFTSWLFTRGMKRLERWSVK